MAFTLKFFVILLFSYISVRSLDNVNDQLLLLAKNFCDAKFGPNATEFNKCFDERKKTNPFPYSVPEQAHACDKQDDPSREIRETCAAMASNTPRGDKVLNCVANMIKESAEKANMTAERAMVIHASDVLLCT